MALPAWQATIVTDEGDIIPSPVITVLIEATGLPATLFSDRAGTAPLGTGGVFTAGIDGFAQFYADPAEYRVTASDSGSGFSQTLRYIPLSGSDAFIAMQTSPTDTTAGRGVTTEALGDNGGPIFTEGNLNPNIFGGVGAGDDIMYGWALTSTILRVRCYISSFVLPAGITVQGTFSVRDQTTNAFAVGLTSPDFSINSSSSNRMVTIDVLNQTGMVPFERYLIRTDSSSSKIEITY